MSVRRGVVGGLAAAVCCTLVAGCGGTPRGIDEVRPLAVVLAMAPENVVSLVDLESGDVLETIVLRSLATDVGVDAISGSLVTAQCGGVGNDCDTVLGLYDIGSGGSVRYVDSVEPNPLGVLMVAPGTALIVNGCVTDLGVAVSLVSIPSGEVLVTGGIPDLSSAPVMAGGLIWAHCVTSEGARTWRTIDADTLEWTDMIAGDDVPIAIVGDPVDPKRVFGLYRSVGDSVEVRPIDVATGDRVGVSSVIVALEDGPGRSVMAGDTLVLADYTGADPEAFGTRLLLLQPSLSTSVRTVAVPGGAVALALWGERVIVLEGATGRLFSLDTDAGALEELATVEGAPGFFVDLEVVP